MIVLVLAVVLTGMCEIAEGISEVAKHSDSCLNCNVTEWRMWLVLCSRKLEQSRLRRDVGKTAGMEYKFGFLKS